MNWQGVAQCLRFCLVFVIQVQEPNTQVGTHCVASADGTARACYDKWCTTATSSNSAGPASACWRRRSWIQSATCLLYSICSMFTILSCVGYSGTTAEYTCRNTLCCVSRWNCQSLLWHVTYHCHKLKLCWTSVCMLGASTGRRRRTATVAATTAAAVSTVQRQWLQQQHTRRQQQRQLNQRRPS